MNVKLVHRSCRWKRLLFFQPSLLPRDRLFLVAVFSTHSITERHSPPVSDATLEYLPGGLSRKLLSPHCQVSFRGRPVFNRAMHGPTIMYIVIVITSLNGCQNTVDSNARSGVNLKASRTCMFLALHLTFH
jgi:hypothetical protein